MTQDPCYHRRFSRMSKDVRKGINSGGRRENEVDRKKGGELEVKEKKQRRQKFGRMPIPAKETRKETSPLPQGSIKVWQRGGEGKNLCRWKEKVQPMMQQRSRGARKEGWL